MLKAAQRAHSSWSMSSALAATALSYWEYLFLSVYKEQPQDLSS